MKQVRNKKKNEKVAYHTLHFICSLTRALRPKEKMSVSDWADKHMVLPGGSNKAGKFRSDSVPYQKEIMNAITDSAVTEVTVMSSAQIGKTTIVLCGIAYYIEHEPSTQLLVLPTLSLGEKFSKTRLAPMIRDIPVLRDKIAPAKSKDSDNTILFKQYAGGYIVVSGANSAASLSSMPIRVVWMDEVDRFPASAGGEGDPVTLAQKRATTFCAKSVVRMSKNTAAKLAQAIENRKGSLKSVTIKAVNSSKKAKTQISAIDKAFNESRNGTTKSAGEIVSELSFKSGKQYAHLAPSTIHSQKLLRKKAVLAVVACFSAITLSCVTVASALDMKDNNSVQTPALVATNDEAVPNTEIDSESASANLKAISPSCASLYIDGKFIGATEEIDQLNADLEQVLVDYRRDYDDETTTEFANSVEVVTGNASDTTDIVYTRDVAYDTKVKYDEDKSSSYKKVTTKGVNGEEEVT